MNKYLIPCAFGIFFCALLSFSQEKPTYQKEIEAIIAGTPELTEDQQALLIELVREKLSGQTLPGDKAAHAVDDFRVYFAEFVRHSKTYRKMDAFDLSSQLFAWQFGNFVGCPGLSKEERERTTDLLNNIRTALRIRVKSAFADTPANVRNQLADDVVTLFGKRSARYCNYFYPATLYAEEGFSAMDVLDQVNWETFSDRYAVVADILSNESADLRSREMHVNMFLEREAFEVAAALEPGLRKGFGKKWLASYQPIPDELDTAVLNFRDRVRNAPPTPAEAAPPTLREYETEINDLLEGSGTKVIDGQLVDLREEASLGDQAATPPLTAETANDTKSRLLMLLLATIGIVAIFVFVRARRKPAS